MNKQIDIEELLDWYIFAGVTETCGDLPCLNSQPLVLDDNKKLLQQSVKTQKTPVSLSENISRNAKDICSKASSLEELKEILIKFEGCNLKNTAASTILGDGSACAKVMLIGEAPGADEDRIGKPFVGRCGKLLDKMLEAININREDCYITNVLPWRPPGNRTPTDDELAVCLPFLKRQIELIKPDYILLLGGISLKSLIDTADSISRARGKWFEYDIDETKKANVLATYHPSYLLRSTAQKSKVWADLLRLKKKINENV
ncbi:MAG: uracil-DNA glycosylase [Alphaproteobacteria bacterium]|nr:uracil-DNA glycosylase [Alphaproteobacteria bacterium]